MPPAVHLRPDRLRVHAAEATDLATGLRAALESGPEGDRPELDRWHTGLRRAVQELAELSAVLVAAADNAERADAAAARVLLRVDPR